jgi:hypothetical protein
MLAGNVKPFVVSVPVELPKKRIPPEFVHVIPVADVVSEYITSTFPVPATVTLPDAGPEILRVLGAVIDPTVTVYAVALDAELKIASSVDVGMLAPPLPPDVADQFAVFAPFQVPDPPTQYLAATVILPEREFLQQLLLAVQSPRQSSYLHAVASWLESHHP